MAINDRISNTIVKVDKLLEKKGLYTTVTYIENTQDTSTYDPITGSYATSSSTTYTFSGVSASVSTEETQGNASKSRLQLIILPVQLSGKFSVEVDQVYTINNENWKVSSFEVAPQDAVTTVNLRRK